MNELQKPILKMEMSEHIDHANMALRELIHSAVAAVDDNGLAEVVGNAVVLEGAIARLVSSAAHVVEINRPNAFETVESPRWLKHSLDKCATERTAQVILKAYDEALETLGLQGRARMQTDREGQPESTDVQCQEPSE